jgi:hypothetical protein
MVVPIHKKWEANTVRLQVIQQEKIVQLVAFFGDFSHGRCMNFVLKSTDIFESFNRSGKSGIKIVDAKFALPKSQEDEAAEFVCLDMPEYPAEHDDITITFDSDKGKKDDFWQIFHVDTDGRNTAKTDWTFNLRCLDQ